MLRCSIEAVRLHVLKRFNDSLIRASSGPWTFLILRTFSNTSRLHDLKLKNKNPSKTLGSYRNWFL